MDSEALEAAAGPADATPRRARVLAPLAALATVAIGVVFFLAFGVHGPPSSHSPTTVTSPPPTIATPSLEPIQNLQGTLQGTNAVFTWRAPGVDPMDVHWSLDDGKDKGNPPRNQLTVPYSGTLLCINLVVVAQDGSTSAKFQKCVE